jgi:hypothetical protein
MTTEELHEIIEQIKNIKFHPQTLTMINTREVTKQSCTLPESLVFGLVPLLK